MRKQPLIFIVDDDQMVQKLIAFELRSIKVEAMCFDYGEDCLTELSLRPDLIILDYIFVKGSTPVMGGLEILRKIREYDEHVPVIILSGQDSGNAVLDLIKLGIEEYIIKENNFVSRLKEAVLAALNPDLTS